MWGNYLRVRGEYKDQPKGLVPYRELPPRARRIHRSGSSPQSGLGTTSACAENTGGFFLDDPKIRNYLRVRGEYVRVTCFDRLAEELPPRARRILGADTV